MRPQLYETEYVSFSDEALAALAAEKDQTAFSVLLERYNRLMLSKVSTIAPRGLDTADLMQECALGLLDAVRGFSANGGAAFRTFASVCIDNRLKSVLRKSARIKNRLMTDYVELSDATESEDLSANPELQMLVREGVDELRHYMSVLLSDTEQKVFSLYLQGNTYDHIAKAVGISSKSVDNALQRVRRKLKSAVSEQ